MKIYVASSWRNPDQPKVVEVLRAAGHQVYDFRNPDPADPTNIGFAWQQVDSAWESGEKISVERWRSMLSNPLAENGYNLDFGAMKWADICIYVLPCGRSASFELGWMKGVGKRCVVLSLGPVEPDLMFRDCIIVGSLAEMLDAVGSA